MDANAGRFIMPDEMSKFKKDLRELERIQKLPTLAIGEVVEIKGVKFTVRRIKADGRLGLRMVKSVGGEGN